LPKITPTVKNSKKPKEIKIDIGNYNPKPKVKRKIVKLKDKEIRVIKANDKTLSYRIRFGENKSKILQLSPKGRTLIKKYPELIDFISKHFFNHSQAKDYFLNNSKLDLKLSLIYKNGLNHKKLLKLDVYFKKEKKNHVYFFKESENILANKEFMANQVFQKFGIKTIKPHFAFTDLVKRENVICYDFSNLRTFNEAIESDYITNKERDEINKKINNIKSFLELPVRKYPKKGIIDYTNVTNIFVKKVNGKIELYFTDLAVW